MFGFKKKNPCIKHKLWGKLKEDARLEYKIFPLEYSEGWVIERSDYGCYYRIDDKVYNSIDSAKERLELLRQELFYKLCNKALYMRKYRKVEKF